MHIIPSKTQILVNQIKESYMQQVDLTCDQIQKLKLIEQNTEVLTPDERFIVGYLNLFIEDNAQKAYEYFESAIEDSEQIQVDFAKVYSYKFLAQKYIEMNDLDKGIQYTEAALYSIPTRKHGAYRNLINDIIRPVLDLKEGRGIVIDFLEYILAENYKHPNKEAELYAYRTLDQLYLLQGNYPRSIEMSINAIHLAEQLNKEYFRGKAALNLARINYKLGNHEEALELIHSVESIQTEDEEWNDKLNIYRLLMLSQIEMKKENYNQALGYIIEFDKYKQHLTDEDRQDIEIVQNINKAHIYTIKNKVNIAHLYLEKAEKIIEKDKVVYWPDKDIYYYLIYGGLNEQKENYDIAISSYEEVKILAIERNSIDGVEAALSRLQDVYNKKGDYSASGKAAMELIQVRVHQRQKINQDYYNYINQKYEMKKIKKNIMISIGVSVIFGILILIGAIWAYKAYIGDRVRKIRLKRKIEDYLESDAYLMYYQPIVNPKKHKVVGFEALLRLKIQDQIVMPYIFFKEIEQADMMGKVSIWILNEVIKNYQQIKDMPDIVEDFYISMNVSFKEVEDDEIVNKMLEILEHAQLNAKAICIEITENIGISDVDRVKHNIAKLRSGGFKIAIDDFGAEYSNFSTINHVEYDIVKIDKVYISNIEQSNIGQHFINFCDYIFTKEDKIIIVEGVEQEYQVEYIKKTQSDKFYIQGYFYSKPIELEKLIELRI